MHSHSEFLRAHVEHILVWHIWHVTKQDDTTHYQKKNNIDTRNQRQTDLLALAIYVRKLLSGRPNE